MSDSDEEWRDIRGWEGFYQVSTMGRVKSLARAIPYRGGKKFGWKEETILGQTLVGAKRRLYRRVVLSDRSRKRHALVHVLMAETFLADTYFPGAQVLHQDDDQFNNVIDNLRWGTPSENMFDKVKNGYHHQAKKSECLRGHSLTILDNLVPSGLRHNKRECRSCRNALSKAHRMGRATDEEFIQSLADEYYENRYGRLQSDSS